MPGPSSRSPARGLLLVSLSSLAQGILFTTNEEVVARGGDPIPFRDWNAEPPVSDDGHIHIASTACRAGCDYMASLTRTIAAQSKLEGIRKPVLHIFMDWVCFNRFRELGREEPQILESLDVRTYDIMKMELMDGRTEATKHGKRCTMVRLFLPRLFPRLPRLLYLDYDTIVLNSLQPLWNMPVPVISMGENDELFHPPRQQPDFPDWHCPRWKNGTVVKVKSSIPGMPDSCYPGYHGLNAGVLLFNLTGWRLHNIDQEVDYWASRFLSGEIDMLMNDQDILNLIIVQHEDYHSPLPCEHNLLFTHRWMCLFEGGSWRAWDEKGKKSRGFQRNQRRPVVIHDKFGHNVNRQTWRWMYNRTNHFAKLVNAGELRNGTSLCEVFHCERQVMEESYTCPCKPESNKVPCDCKLRDYYVEDKQYKHYY